MISANSKWKSKDFPLIVLFLQIIECTVLFFDVPIVRQIVGFFFLSFIPGLIILVLLGLNEFDKLETIILSVGLSIALLMVIGLLLTLLSNFIGISQPLSLMPLIVAINSFVTIGCIFIFFRNAPATLDKKLFSMPFSGLFLAFLPIISAVGAIWANAYGANQILVFLIMAIALLFVIIVLSKRLSLSKLYPFIVFFIALALLYHSSFSSNYVFGPDSHFEHQVLRETALSGNWLSINPYPGDLTSARFYSMLSITILPTIYSTLLNIDPAWVLKLLFPLFFSLVPLGLYKIWSSYIGKKYAFISAFVLMAQSTFYTEMMGLARQMIAELFFVLLCFLILKKNIKRITKLLLFTFFSFGIVVSHYATSEIFLFYICLTLLFYFLSSFVTKRHRGHSSLTIQMVVLFSVIMFFWYIYTSGSSTFTSFIEFGDYVVNQLGDFFNPASRGITVLRGLGLESPPTVWNAVGRAFAYFTEAFIIVGFIELIMKRGKSTFDKTYSIFVTVSFGLLVGLVAIPGLAQTLNMTRFYHILLFFLAPLVVLGSTTLAGLAFKRKKHILSLILLLVVLVPYFIFQTNLAYEVTRSESVSPPLSGYRLGPRLYTEHAIVAGSDIFGAQWLSRHSNVENITVYAGYIAPLLDYGMVPFSRTFELNNVTALKGGDYVYLATLNTVYGLIVSYGNIWNTSDVQASSFPVANKIYANGECEIYMNSGST